MSVHPCSNKILFGYDVSADVSDVAETQKQFLNNEVFIPEWSNFYNLALMAYSNNTAIKYFDTMQNLEDVHTFIETSLTNTTNNSISLCDVFNLLTKMYLRDINIILFVSRFDGLINNDCLFWIKQIHENANSIDFITLTQFDVDSLQSLLPQSRFIYWNITSKVMPVDLIPHIQKSYECEEYVTYALQYPCNTGNYDNIVNGTKEQTLSEVKLFIRRQYRSNKEPSLCNAFYEFMFSNTESQNIVFFVSKFDERSLGMNKFCSDYINNMNKPTNSITFVVLNPRTNMSFVKELFPKANIIQWDVDKLDEPVDWIQEFWIKGFGCDGTSPIKKPTASTVRSTKPMTTTKIKSSTSIKTSFSSKQTTQMITSTSHQKDTTTTLSVKAKTQSTNKSGKKTFQKSFFKHQTVKFIETIYVSIFVPLFVILLIAFLIFVCFYRQRQRQQFIDNLAFGIFGRIYEEFDRKRNKDLWQIPSKDVEIFMDKQLGSGAFANVYLGRLYGESGIKRVYSDVIALNNFCDCDVAIKVLPPFASSKSKEDFRQEIQFMKRLKHHVHIVCLLGYSNNQTQIILEYCANGDLLHFLRRNKDKFDKKEDIKNLISIAWQIANGMTYFASLNLIHRDLAARNVLLDANNICKIGDFGLARLGDMHTYSSKGGKIPIRWSPTEVLKNFEYSLKSDVWSYGIVLYEVFTLGNLPYSGINNTQILTYLEASNRLEQPEHANIEIYNLMMSCWNSSPDERPMFSEICQKLIPILEAQNLLYNYVEAIETNEIDILSLQTA